MALVALSLLSLAGFAVCLPAQQLSTMESTAGLLFTMATAGNTFSFFPRHDKSPFYITKIATQASVISSFQN